jgi:putative glutamine amidotransferase
VSLPRIGITGRIASVDGADRAGVNGAYCHAVTAAGAVPIILPPVEGDEAITAMLDGVDGIILSGGADIDPARYGTQPHPKLGTVDAVRDAFEFAVFAEVQRRKLPTLAICRGLQLANVAMGGTLWQDLPSERAPHPQSGARTDRVHEVHVIEGSKLGDALRGYDLTVNSFHHQAIRDLAPGLADVAWSKDGLIEGVEIFGDWWFVGVQWHPEEFWKETNSPDLDLFRSLRVATTWQRA